MVHALVELAIGLAVGVVIGAGGARLLVSARRRSWSNAAGERLAVLVLPVITYLTATALGGNGFVAAFVAGIAAGTVGREEVAEERLQLTNDVGTLMSAAVWFVFGSLIPHVVARGISWNFRVDRHRGTPRARADRGRGFVAEVIAVTVELSELLTE